MSARRLSWLWPVVALGFGVIAVRLFERVAFGPLVQFNATRVATSIAMARGHNVMMAADEGPILDFMYGPVSAMAYAPMALSPTPSGAIWSGIVLSYAFALAPFVWLATAGGALRPRVLALLAIACFGILCFFDPALTIVALQIHADAPTLFLAACACACLVTGPVPNRAGRLVASALLAVLAVWSKQTAVPIVLALPAFLWLRDGWPVARRFTWMLAGVGGLVSAAFVLAFGFEGIWFTMFQMPGGHEWKSADGKLAAALGSLGLMAVAAGPVLLLMALAAGLSHRGGSLRGWLRSQPAACLILAGLAMAPLAVLGGAKIGGNTNAYAFTTWFWLAAAVLILGGLAAGSGWRRHLALALLLGVVAIGAGEMLRGQRRTELAFAASQLRNWRANPVETATAFARARPGEVLFAANPLIGLYSDGVLYHSIIGFADRRMSGYWADPELWRRHLPPQLRYIALRKRGSPPKPPGLPFPATFDEPYRGGELPHHHVWIGEIPASYGSHQRPEAD